ncbi:MAG: Spy/CpxP family protein refolding chaperone [Campylobacteraceae bacterium]
MKKGILVASVATLVIGSNALFAQAMPMQGMGQNQNNQANCQFQDGNECPMGNPQGQMMGNNQMMHGGFGHNKGGKMMHDGFGKGGHDFMFLDGVNLTPEQRYKISILKDEMKLELKKARGTEWFAGIKKHFSESKFDKSGFINTHKAQSNKAIEIRADFMEKVYNELSADQKKIVLENMNKMPDFNSGKNFNNPVKQK